MNSYPIRLLVKPETEGTLLIKAMIRHPNDNGFGRTAEGEPIPAHYLTEVTVSVNSETVATLHSGSGLAADPLFGWRVNGRAGDTVRIGWQDNLGNQGSAASVAPLPATR